MKTIVEKKKQPIIRWEFKKHKKILSCSRISLNSLNKKTKDMTEMVSKISNTLNHKKQPVNTQGCNVPDGAQTGSRKRL